MAMLVGGTGSGVRYSDRDWQQLGSAMVALADSQGIQWLLTTSRGTCPQAPTTLRRYLNEQNCFLAVSLMGRMAPIPMRF